MICREVGILRTIDHPSIVRFLEYFLSPKRNRVFVIMELLEGGDLLSALSKRRGNTFTEADAAKVFHPVLRGLEYLHGRGIVHRDLKLENILLADEGDLGSAKIADFGMARKAADRAKAGPPEEGAFRTLCGTPAYLVRGGPQEGPWGGSPRRRAEYALWFVPVASGSALLTRTCRRRPAGSRAPRAGRHREHPGERHVGRRGDFTRAPHRHDAVRREQRREALREDSHRGARHGARPRAPSPAPPVFARSGRRSRRAAAHAAQASKVWEGVSDLAQSLVCGLLNKDPEARFAGARAPGERRLCSRRGLIPAPGRGPSETWVVSF